MYRKKGKIKDKSPNVRFAKEGYWQELKKMDSALLELVAKKKETALEVDQINWEIVETGLPYYLKFRDLLSQSSIKENGIPEDEYFKMLGCFFGSISTMSTAAIDLLLSGKTHVSIFQLSASIDFPYNLPHKVKFDYLAVVICLNTLLGSSAHVKFCAEKLIEMLHAAKLKSDKYKIENGILQSVLLYFSLHMQLDPVIESIAMVKFWIPENLKESNTSFYYLEQRYIKKPLAKMELLFAKRSCNYLIQTFNYLNIFNTAYYNQNRDYDCFIKKIDVYAKQIDKQIDLNLNELIAYQSCEQNLLVQSHLTAEEYFAKSKIYQQKVDYPLATIKKLSDGELTSLQNILKLAVKALKQIQAVDLEKYRYKIQIQALQCLKQYIAISCHFEKNNKLKELDKYSFYARYITAFEKIRGSVTSEEELLNFDMLQLIYHIVKCYEPQFDIEKIRKIFQAVIELTKELVCKDPKKPHLIDTEFSSYIINLLDEYIESFETDITILSNCEQYLKNDDHSQLMDWTQLLEKLKERGIGEVFEREILTMQLRIRLRIFKLQGLAFNHEECRTEVISKLTKAYEMNARNFVQVHATYEFLKTYNLDHFDYNFRLKSVKEKLIRVLMSSIEVVQKRMTIISLLSQFCTAALPEFDLEIINPEDMTGIGEILTDFSLAILQKIENDYGSKMKWYFADILNNFIKIIAATDPSFLPKTSMQLITKYIVTTGSQALEQLILVERLKSNAFSVNETIAYCLLYINQANNCLVYDRLVKIYTCLFECLIQNNDYANAEFYVESALKRIGYVESFFRVKTRLRAIFYKDQIAKMVDDILIKTLDGFSLIYEIKQCLLNKPGGFDPHCLDKYKQEKVFAYEEYEALKTHHKKIDKSYQLLLTAIKVFKEYTSLHSQGVSLTKKAPGLLMPNIQARMQYPFQSTDRFYRALVDTTAMDNLTSSQLNTINKVCDLFEDKALPIVSSDFVWNPADIIYNIAALVQQVEKQYCQFTIEASTFNDAFMQYEKMHQERKLAYTIKIEGEKKLEEEKKAAVLKIKDQELQRAIKKEQGYLKTFTEKKLAKEKKVEEGMQAKALVANSRKVFIKSIEEESVNKRNRSKLNSTLTALEQSIIEEQIMLVKLENNKNVLILEQKILEQKIKESLKSEENITNLIAILGGKGSELELNYFSYIYTLQKQLQCTIILKGSLLIRLAILHFNNNPKLAADYPIANDIDLAISTIDLQTLKVKLEGLGFSCIKVTKTYHKFQNKASHTSPIIYDLTTEGPHYHSKPFLPLQWCSGTFVDLDEVQYEEAKAQNLPIVPLGPYYIKLHIKEGYEEIFENACKLKEFLIKKPKIGYSSYCYMLYKNSAKLIHCNPNINLDNRISPDESFIPYNEVFSALKIYFIDLFKSVEQRISPYIELIEFVKKGIQIGTEQFAKPIIAVFFEALLLFQSAGKMPEAECIKKSKEAAKHFIENQATYKTEDGSKIIELINVLAENLTFEKQLDSNSTDMQVISNSFGFFYGSQHRLPGNEDLSLTFF